MSSPGARRVVIGVDFDEPSLATARWVAGHVAPDAELVLVHVLPVPRAPAFLSRQLRSPAPFVAQVGPAMRGGLEGFASTLDAREVRVEVRVGEPAEQLAL
ncbi:MAG: universal stress protein, partial [Gemmatimonadaceae bacterium]